MDKKLVVGTQFLNGKCVLFHVKTLGNHVAKQRKRKKNITIMIIGAFFFFGGNHDCRSCEKVDAPRNYLVQLS